jgi:hypothetical protein
MFPMFHSRRPCLVALTAIALAFSLGPGPVSAEDAKEKKLETTDFDVSIPAGWVGRAIADPSQKDTATVLLDCAAGRVRLLVTSHPGPAKGSPEETSSLKEMREEPGMGAASFVMPMALKTGGPATLVFDELDLAGEPTAGACVISAANADSFTAFHGAARIVGDRMLLVAVITKGKQGAPGATEVGEASGKAQMQAVAQAYKLVRELRLKKRP